MHTGAIALLLAFSSRVLTKLPDTFDPAAKVPLLAPRFARGAGGGQQQLSPASAGHLPRIAPRQFVPPMPVVNPQPKLAMEISIEAPPEALLPDRPLPNLGDPLSRIAGQSAGSGGPLGIDDGRGVGIGDTMGSGVGSGDDAAGTVYKAGAGVTAPVVLRQVEPEFSEEARRARHSGIVLVRIDVDAAGVPRNLRVVQSLGMGLDEKAMEAVAKWKFRPGTRNGKPVPVTALVQVMFHLL